MNVFERALEIVEEHGWYQSDRIGPAGERCLFEAWSEASTQLYPEPQRRWWQRELPWPVVAARRVRAIGETRALRAAVEEVNGGPFRGGEYVWNDDPGRSEEDIRLALKLAARNLEDTKGS